jgi:hypothetical protein
MTHTEDSAHNEYAHVGYEARIIERHLSIIETKAKNQAICQDKRLVARIRKDLERDISKKYIARNHGIPHHTVMYIWRDHGNNDA